MNCSLTRSWNSCSHSINPKWIFFHSINWWFCLFLVWIHSTWCHFNDFSLNGESSIIAFQWQARWSTSMHQKLYPNSNCDANTIQATNMRWGGTTLKSLQPSLVPMPNTNFSHSWLSHYNCQTEMGWPNLNDWKKIFARDDHPKIDLNLMWNQSTCLNALITLSKFPIMMQTQIQATNMRWGGATLKSLQPCLVSMLNTTICHNWLSHYNCQTEMWWPNLDDWKRNLARDNQYTVHLNLMNNNSTAEFEQLKEKSCKRSPSNNWLDLDKKSINLHWIRKAKKQ